MARLQNTSPIIHVHLSSHIQCTSLNILTNESKYLISINQSRQYKVSIDITENQSVQNGMFDVLIKLHFLYEQLELYHLSSIVPLTRKFHSVMIQNSHELEFPSMLIQ